MSYAGFVSSTVGVVFASSGRPRSPEPETPHFLLQAGQPHPEGHLGTLGFLIVVMEVSIWALGEYNDC